MCIIDLLNILKITQVFPKKLNANKLFVFHIVSHYKVYKLKITIDPDLKPRRNTNLIFPSFRKT